MDYRQYLDPEDMTEEEQYDRIVHLLALACSRIAKRAKGAPLAINEATIVGDLKNGDSTLNE